MCYGIYGTLEQAGVGPEGQGRVRITESAVAFELESV
jgi:hypothetical protein